MDYETAKRILKTPIVKSFSKTRFLNAKLRKQSLIWAINLPSGKDLDSQIESIYHVTYKGSIIKFGKPGKEVFRKRNPNQYDMTPILYEKRNGKISRTAKGFNFFEMLKDIKIKINYDEQAGFVLAALLYRCGILEDHAFLDNKFSYTPDVSIMKWLAERLENGDFPPSELIPMYDAIMLNDDIKLYMNPMRYQSGHMEPYGPRGRINTMGAIFAICAPEKLLSRIELSSLLITGRGTPRIFSKAFEYGRPIISKMTGGIIDDRNDQMKLQ